VQKHRERGGQVIWLRGYSRRALQRSYSNVILANGVSPVADHALLSPAGAGVFAWAATQSSVVVVVDDAESLPVAELQAILAARGPTHVVLTCCTPPPPELVRTALLGVVLGVLAGPAHLRCSCQTHHSSICAPSHRPRAWRSFCRA
jgi:hypothetical protein